MCESLPAHMLTLSYASRMTGSRGFAQQVLRAGGHANLWQPRTCGEGERKETGGRTEGGREGEKGLPCPTRHMRAHLHLTGLHGRRACELLTMHFLGFGGKIDDPSLLPSSNP